MLRLRIWHGMVFVAAAGLMFGLDADFPHAVVGLFVISLSACLGIAGSRHSGRSVWSGIWPILIFGPLGLFITWTYPVIVSRSRAGRSS